MWLRLKEIFQDNLTIPDLKLENSFFGFLDIEKRQYKIINHLLLIFKRYVYNARAQGRLSLNELINEICKIKNLELKICGNNKQKVRAFREKWQMIERHLK